MKLIRFWWENLSAFSDHPLVINKSQILVLEEIARILIPPFF